MAEAVDTKQLARELARVVVVRASPVALEGIAQQIQGLLRLTCVSQAVAPTPHDLAVRLVDVLRSIVAGVPDKSVSDGLMVLFGLTASSRYTGAVKRRELASEKILPPGTTGTTFLRRHQEDVLISVAERLDEHERQFRLRAAFVTMSDSGPVLPAMAVEWLDLFRYYSHLWSPLWGLAADLRKIRDPKTKRPKLDPMMRERSSLWFFARYRHELSRFIDERAGHWVVSDADNEEVIANSVYLIGRHSPFTELELSMVAEFIPTEAPSASLALFARSLDSDPTLQSLLAKWVAWIGKCECEDWKDGLRSCKVHEVIRQAELYTVLVDKEWYTVASWYRQPPSVVPTYSVDLSSFERTMPFEDD